MKKLLYVFSFITCTSFAQITLIPDSNFEQVLLDLNIDSDGIINGQMATSDALAVINLTISYGTPQNYPYQNSTINEGYIYDLTGIEAFVNLESLKINQTYANHINLNTLVNLKQLDCIDNLLSTIDLSNNILLEEFYTSNEGDVLPVNYIIEIDLSNNPNIHTLRANGSTKINLNNNSNNLNTTINVGVSGWGFPPGQIFGNVCIKVDNPIGAQSNQYPYSQWTVLHNNMTYSYTDDLTTCNLATTSANIKKPKIYPNPVTTVLNIETQEAIDKIEIIDILGKRVIENTNSKYINVENIARGVYILKATAGGKTVSENFIKQ